MSRETDPGVKVDALAVELGGARGTPIHVLRDISAVFRAGEIAVIVGPSGSGKTTLLNVLAGVVPPTAGEITRLGSLASSKGSGYVFQEASLIPWLTVRRNILFGAEIAGSASDGVLAQLEGSLQRFGLDGFMDVYPAILSGGMQQRIAILRAVLSGAKLLLLDEPFSGSDMVMRRGLHQLVSELVTTENLVSVMVTHDLQEVVRLADRVFVFTHRPGRIKAEIEIPIPRVERLASGFSLLAKLEPFLSAVWEALSSADVCAEAEG